MQLPKVDLLISNLPDMWQKHKRAKETVQNVLDELRRLIYLDHDVDLSVNVITEEIIKKLNRFSSPSLKRVVNATGIVLHTNLGRAVLSRRVMDHVVETMTHYNTLEFNLETGSRGSRYQHVESILCRLTGAEGAVIVNNNAAAVMLILNTFAKDKEVIISRGELVEIGGSFRIPSVMTASQSIMVEVGTTNKTHLYDYAQAIQSETRMVLKVHTSNYKVLGFTESVSRSELSKLAQDHEIVFYEDLGSGLLFETPSLKPFDEPIISKCLEEGCDILSFSGDKLVGASQAGIILGKRHLIDQIKKNQLLRAFRIDKLSLAVLEGTLLLYESCNEELPTHFLLGLSDIDILDKVQSFVKQYREQLNLLNMVYEIIPMTSEVGGGALPLEKLPSYGLAIKSKIGLNQIQYDLREYEIPVITVIRDDALHINFRTIFESDYEILLEAFKQVIR